MERLDDSLAITERIVREAEQYVWLMADQNVRQSYPRKHPEQVSRRLLLPKESDLQDFQHLAESCRGLRLQIGFVDNVKVTVVMNEKMAAVCFTGLDGRMDFTQGLSGRDTDVPRLVS